MISLNTPLVSVEWLHSNLNVSNLVVLDASIPKVTDGNTSVIDVQIPKARFFDLKNKFSDASTPFPTTFPSAEQFSKSAQELGIDNNSALVIYDDKGIYSSPRVWWLFKAFGYDNAAVLDGGLPAWQNANYDVENKQDYTGLPGNFKAKYRPGLMKFFEDIKNESQDAKHTIIDARSEARFKGLVPEPRVGLRSGTIPNSVNIPYTDLFKDYCFKTMDELRTVFGVFAGQESNITFTCGSGITACVLALGAEMAGYQNISVYDGSWTEWGSLMKE